MKFALISVAILACFANLGEAQTTAPPATTHAPGTTLAPVTTHAPAPVTTQPPVTTAKPTAPPTPKPTVVPKGPSAVTIKEIQDHINSDPAIAGLFKKVTQLQNEVSVTEKLFEVDLQVRNITLLNTILNQVKSIRGAQTSVLLVEIQSEIASAQPRSFLNRLLLESLRIQTITYDRTLKWIGLEILGDLSDVSKFENYYYSETVSIARQLLLARYLDMLVASYEIDIILEEARKKDPLNLHIDADTRTKVDKHLKDILSWANVAKKEIANDYYQEVERIRLDNRELNLLQRTDMEMNIDLLNDSVNFITKYEELFLRINTV